MTLTTPSPPATDAKAGYCMRCRNGQHTLCASPAERCGCPYTDHPNRPDASPLDDVRSRAEASLTAAASTPTPAPTPPAPAPAKLCGYCRARNHKACTSATCPCDARSHPGRPGAAPAAADQAGDGAAKAKVEPVWELVKDAPPAPPPKPKKITPAELVRPMLETIVEAGDRDPWRVALFGTTYAAGQAKKVLAKEYAHNWEWTSTRDSEGRPALFVRWLGPQQAGQL